jgi:hypothetical protein
MAEPRRYKKKTVAKAPKKSPRGAISVVPKLRTLQSIAKRMEAPAKNETSRAKQLATMKKLLSQVAEAALPGVSRAVKQLPKKRHTKMAKLPSAPYYAKPGRQQAALEWRPRPSTASKSKTTRVVPKRRQLATTRITRRR